MTWQVAALWGATPFALVGVYWCFRGSCSFHSQDRFSGGLSVTVMGAAVALNQATSRSIPEDISPQINSWFQFWRHLTIMTLPVCVVEIYNWESGGTFACVCVWVCCCSTVCRLQTSWSTILSVCSNKKSLMDAVSNQWIAVGFVGLVFTGRLEFANKNCLWLDHTLSSCGLLLIPGLSSCRHVMVYVFTKIIMTECTSYRRHSFCFL